MHFWFKWFWGVVSLIQADLFLLDARLWQHLTIFDHFSASFYLLFHYLYSCSNQFYCFWVLTIFWQSSDFLFSFSSTVIWQYFAFFKAIFSNQKSFQFQPSCFHWTSEQNWQVCQIVLAIWAFSWWWKLFLAWVIQKFWAWVDLIGFILLFVR